MITLQTLKNASEYDVIRQVGTHLLRQNAKSVGKTGECRYRGVGGRKCAAGCLIADAEYSGEMEEKIWEALAEDGRVPKAHEWLIQKLQYLHDHREPHQWAEGLRGICAKCGVDDSWIDGVTQ